MILTFKFHPNISYNIYISLLDSLMYVILQNFFLLNYIYTNPLTFQALHIPRLNFVVSCLKECAL